MTLCALRKSNNKRVKINNNTIKWQCVQKESQTIKEFYHKAQCLFIWGIHNLLKTQWFTTYDSLCDIFHNFKKHYLCVDGMVTHSVHVHGFINRWCLDLYMSPIYDTDHIWESN